MYCTQSSTEEDGTSSSEGSESEVAWEKEECGERMGSEAFAGGSFDARVCQVLDDMMMMEGKEEEEGYSSSSQK